MNWFQNGHIDHVDKCFGSYIIDLSLSPRNLVFVNTIGKILTLRAQGHGQVMGFCGATAPLSSLREQGDRCYRSRNFLGHSGCLLYISWLSWSETERRSENTFKRNWVLLKCTRVEYTDVSILFRRPNSAICVCADLYMVWIWNFNSFLPSKSQRNCLPKLN